MAESLAAVSTPSQAVDFSANIGWNSQYIYRDIPQKNSSAFAGLDREAGGFQIGTWDFDDTYKEANLSAGWRWITFDAAIGSYDNFAVPRQEYEWYALTAEQNGFYGRVATFENDFDGMNYEAGHGDTLGVQDTDLFDCALSVIYSDSTLLGGGSDTNFVLTLSKSFDF